MKKVGLYLLLFLLGCFLLIGCGKKTNPVECSAGVTKDEKFGAAEVDITQEAFLALGFQLGDSVDIKFSNGTELKDVPFFNGYYVRTGQPVLVAYPGFEKISVTYNNQGIWEQAGLSAGDSIAITLNTAGKYKATQESLGQSYSTKIEEYDDNISFANFRSLSGGALREDYFYRGASPVNNSRERAQTVNDLLEETGIGFVLDLADTADDFEGFTKAEGFGSLYTENLFREGKIALLGMGSSYASEGYHQSLAKGLRMMLENEGPVYIHCLEGKDRTGFVCMLIEALAGASYEEMLTDYMLTYENYYDISLKDTPEKYNAVAELYFNAFAEYLHGTEDLQTLKTADYSEDAKAYLREAGMSDGEIEQLIFMLTGK